MDNISRPSAYDQASSMRKFFWPIFGAEHKKFLPMTIMISLVLFNFTLLRNMKDTLVVTSCGSELTTFLKFYAVAPAAILFFVIYSKLSNIFSSQTIFYGIVTFFLSFFALFAYVLYPYQAYFHPIAFADQLIHAMPRLAQFINMFKFWSFSLFYVMAELWGSIVATFLFWQFANSITKVNEAKRFYGHFYLLANLATAFSGVAAKYFSNIARQAKLADPVATYTITLSYTVGSFLIAGIIVLALYRYMQVSVLTDPELVDPVEAKPKKSKMKLSFSESMKVIFSSRYLAMIAIMVFAYGVTINFVEVSWKNQVKLAFPQPNDYQNFNGDFFFYNGIFTFFMILLGGYVVRVLGWRIAALATPIMIAVTGTLFFSFMIYKTELDPYLLSTFGMGAVLCAVYLGSIQNILAKSTKYALFDPTKEMAYIPLDDELKSKGKAAVDVIGGRLGKAGGAGIQQAIILIYGSLATATPLIAGMMLVVSLIWVFAVVDLSGLFHTALAKKEAEKAASKA
jgi:AAA family ATP:ADP antiporter